MRYWLMSAASAALMLAGSAFAADDHGARCGQESIQGNWGFTLSGTLIVLALPPGTGLEAQPGAAVGRFSIDSRGNVVGQDTTSILARPSFEETFTGTAAVNEDCTGSATITGTVAGETHFDFVLVAKRQEMMMIRKDLGTAIFGSARRQ